MSSGGSFWKRMGGLFGGGGDHPVTQRDGGDGWGLLRRQPGRREQQQEQVLQLMASIQTHFEHSDDRARQFNDSLQSLTRTLEQLSGVQREQSEWIRKIAEQVEGATRHASRLSDTVSQMPASLEAQADAVRTLTRQLEISNEADHRLAESLGQVGQAVDALRTSSTRQVETLERVGARQEDQREAMHTLVKDQGRRFYIAMIAPTILAVAALAALAGTLFLVLNRQ